MCHYNKINLDEISNKILRDENVIYIQPTSPPHTHDQANAPPCMHASVVYPSKHTVDETSACSNKEGVNGDPGIILKKLRVMNNNRLIVAHLNINFLVNKFEALKSLVEGKVDILLISETKIDESFPLAQFILKGCSTPFRADRNSQGGRLLIYIREDIPCKELKVNILPDDVESIFIELIIGRNKWGGGGGGGGGIIPKRKNLLFLESGK